MVALIFGNVRDDLEASRRLAQRVNQIRERFDFYWVSFLLDSVRRLPGSPIPDVFETNRKSVCPGDYPSPALLLLNRYSRLSSASWFRPEPLPSSLAGAWSEHLIGRRQSIPRSRLAEGIVLNIHHILFERERSTSIRHANRDYLL